MERQRLLDASDGAFDGASDVSLFKTDTNKSEPVITSRRRPLVNLEGGDWLLTTLLITLDAILVRAFVLSTA